MKIDIKLIIIIILSAVLAFSSFKCGEYKQKFDSQALANQKLDSINNKLGQTVYQQQVYITQDRDNFKKYTDSMFSLQKKDQKKIKDVISYYQSILSAKLDNITIPYIDRDTTPKPDWSDTIRLDCQQVIDYYESNTISVPKEARDSTQHYKLSFEILKDSLKVNNIELIDTQHIRFVTLKGGLFKKDVNGKFHIIKDRETVAQVLHSNPFIKVNGQQSALFVPKKKSKIVKNLLLIGGGIFIGSKL